MIDSRRTGGHISRLRKQRDWTQLQLADQLHVTHQAVSRWESGESFPDLATLANIAQLFNVTIDDLLNGEHTPSPIPAPDPAPGEATSPAPEPTNPDRVTPGSILTELAQGRIENVAQMLKSNQASLQALVTAAPLASPSMMRGVMEQMESKKIDLQHLVELAPFLDEETLITIIENAGSDEMTPRILGEFAPFLGKQALERYVDRILAGTLSAKNLDELAPFLSRETLDRLVDGMGQEGQLSFNQLEALAPHLSHQTLDKLVDRYMAGDVEFSAIAELAPFLGRDAVDRLFEFEVEKHEGTDAEELLPFISKQKMGDILARVLDGQLDSDWLSELAPHLDRDTLNQLVRDRMKSQKDL